MSPAAEETSIVADGLALSRGKGGGWARQWSVGSSKIVVPCQLFGEGLDDFRFMRGGRAYDIVTFRRERRCILRVQYSTRKCPCEKIRDCVASQCKCFLFDAVVSGDGGGARAARATAHGHGQPRRTLCMPVGTPLATSSAAVLGGNDRSFAMGKVLKTVESSGRL